MKAMNRLRRQCLKTNDFYNLAHRRQRVQNARLAYLSSRAALLINQRITDSNGLATFKQVSAALAGIERAATTRPMPEPASMLKPLHAVLADGRNWICRAREAVRKGGADIIANDLTMSKRQMLARLRRGDELLRLLQCHLHNSSALITEHVDELDRFGDWAEGIWAYLSASFELGFPNVVPKHLPRVAAKVRTF